MSMCVCFFFVSFYFILPFRSFLLLLLHLLLNAQCPMSNALFNKGYRLCSIVCIVSAIFSVQYMFLSSWQKCQRKKTAKFQHTAQQWKKKRFHSNTSCIWPIGPYFCMCVSFFSSFLIIIIQPFSITTHSIVYTVVHCSRPWWSQALKLTTLSALTHYYYYHQSRSFLFFGSVVCPYALAHFEIVYTLYEGDRIVVAIGQSD